MQEIKIGAEKVLVTGGSGFIASWCIIELLRRGYRVRATMRTAARERDLRAMIETQIDARDRLLCVVADLGSDAGWIEAVRGSDYILHIASPFPSERRG
jgi:dihydroflavonol-4-reductase